MFDSSELSKELHALQADVSRLFETAREGIRDTSKTHAETLADQIKAALNELGETLSSRRTRLRISFRTGRLRHSPRHSPLASSSAS